MTSGWLPDLLKLAGNEPDSKPSSRSSFAVQVVPPADPPLPLPAAPPPPAAPAVAPAPAEPPPLPEPAALPAPPLFPLPALAPEPELPPAPDVAPDPELPPVLGAAPASSELQPVTNNIATSAKDPSVVCVYTRSLLERAGFTWEPRPNSHWYQRRSEPRRSSAFGSMCWTCLGRSRPSYRSAA